MKPDVLLLDEPTSALDPELVGEVEKSITDAAKSGQTMVLVSHDMNFVYQVADRVLFLDQGKILEQGTPEEVFRHPQKERTKEFLQAIQNIHLMLFFCYNKRSRYSWAFSCYVFRKTYGKEIMTRWKYVSRNL